MLRTLLLASLLAAAPARIAAAGSPLPTIKLRGAGHGPRRALRLTPAVGSKQTLVMTMQNELTMNGARTVVPTMAMSMTVEVVGKDAAGNLSCKIRFDDAHVVDDGRNPAANAAVDKVIRTIKGLTGEIRLSPQGMTLEAHLDMPAGLAPDIRAQLEQLSDSLSKVSSPFPVEPVGLGARWDIQQKVTAGNGLELSQTTEMTLTRITGDVVELGVSTTQTAPKQAITSPQLPPGAKMHVVSWHGDGKGTSHVDLTHSVMPAPATLDLDVGGKMKVDMGDVHQDLEMDMHAKIDLK